MWHLSSPKSGSLNSWCAKQLQHLVFSHCICNRNQRHKNLPCRGTTKPHTRPPDSRQDTSPWKMKKHQITAKGFTGRLYSDNNQTISLFIFFCGKEKHTQKANSGSVLAAVTVGSLFIIGCMLLLFIRRTCHPKRGERTEAAKWLSNKCPLFLSSPWGSRRNQLDGQRSGASCINKQPFWLFERKSSWQQQVARWCTGMKSILARATDNQIKPDANADANANTACWTAS